MSEQKSASALGRWLSVTLAVFVLAAVAALIYTLLSPPPKDAFTEFYILGTGGKAADYPTQLKVGEEANLIVGIINHEKEETSYRIEIKIDGVGYSQLGPIVLEQSEKFEQKATFTMDKPGGQATSGVPVVQARGSPGLSIASPVG